MPPGSDEVVIVTPRPIVIVIVAVAVSLFGELESVRVKVTEVGPAVVGVPVIWPAGLIDSPAGSAVEVNVYGPVPPVPVRPAA
jgi:hypothetical protein